MIEYNMGSLPLEHNSSTTTTACYKHVIS